MSKNMCQEIEWIQAFLMERFKGADHVAVRFLKKGLIFEVKATVVMKDETCDVVEYFGSDEDLGRAIGELSVFVKNDERFGRALG